LGGAAGHAGERSETGEKLPIEFLDVLISRRAETRDRRPPCPACAKASAYDRTSDQITLAEVDQVGHRLHLPIGGRWKRLFIAAGLDPRRFHPAQPVLKTSVPFDTRAAWTGSGKRNESLRLKAAAYRGRPVLFRVLGPWTRPDQAAPVLFGTFSLRMFVLSLLAIPLLAGVVAWRNSRSGRGDHAGALRMALFAFLCMLDDGRGVDGSLGFLVRDIPAIHHHHVIV
jgi:hypothetical protein